MACIGVGFRTLTSGMTNRTKKEKPEKRHFFPAFEKDKKSCETVINIPVRRQNVNTVFTARKVEKMKLSIIESNSVLSKKFILSANNALEKIQGGVMLSGSGKIIEIAAISELIGYINSGSSKNALIYGVAEYPEYRLCTEKKYNENAIENGLPVIPRTKSFFKWPDGSGILLIDYDPKDDSTRLSKADFEARIIELMPEIGEAEYLICDSASSYMFNGDTELTGEKGFRMLVGVQSAANIPKIGEYLFQKSFISGDGYIFVSKSGAKLPRALIDASVWQPNRLDFVFGAECIPPINQRRPEIIIRNQGGGLIDPEMFDAVANDREYEKKVWELKQKAEPESQIKKIELISAKLKEIGADENDYQARLNLESAILQHTLKDDFKIRISGELVSIAEIMENADLYHDKYCCDPLEPEYRNFAPVAWICAKPTHGSPFIHSHAHGGRRFNISQRIRQFYCIGGQRSEIVSAFLSECKKRNMLFKDSVSKSILKIDNDNAILTLEPCQVQFLMDSNFEWIKFNKEGEPKRIDAPKTYSDGVFSAIDADLNPLQGVNDRPVLTLDGEYISENGYHANIESVIVPNDRFFPEPVSNPSADILKRAINALWKPFELFDFCSPVDRGAYLSAIFTALLRRQMPVSPGFYIHAPTAGSGKTKLARCIAILGGGELGLTSFPSEKKDEEIEKLLISIGLRQTKNIIFDNVVGQFSSAALCNWLTSEKFSGRLLGKNQSVSVSTRALMIFTGNNIRPVGDLNRRLLGIRIEPDSARPDKRKFPFDPEQLCKDDFPKMLSAAYTLLLHGIKSDKKTPDAFGDFHRWNNIIRKTVLICSEIDDRFGDPLQSIEDNYVDDPETTAAKQLIFSIYAALGKKAFTARELVQSCDMHMLSGDSGGGDDIAETVEQITPKRSAKQLGNYLKSQLRRRFNIEGMGTAFIDDAGGNSKRGLKYRICVKDGTPNTQAAWDELAN